MPQHIIGERGVVEFARYCNRHTPYIIFRETTKSDFGIDGEVELVVKNADGQLQPTSTARQRILSSFTLVRMT
jgi:hypothetical protein